MKIDGKWEVQKYPHSYGDMVHGNLSALGNGDISFNVLEKDEEMIYIYDSNTFERKDRIPANLVRLKALEIAPNLEVSDDDS